MFFQLVLIVLVVSMTAGVASAVSMHNETLSPLLITALESNFSICSHVPCRIQAYEKV